MSIGKIVSSSITVTVLRVVIGVLFILASYPKIINPVQFSAVVAEYQLLPESLIPFAAIILPWLELMCGMMLVLNVFAQSNALVMMVVLVIFTIGITNNLLRGIVHDCGCFELFEGWFGFQDEISVSTILRDLFLIGLILPILLYGSNVFFRRR